MATSRASPPTDVGADEGDYCRICRGEGTEEEPLFYPCKCSGSIKHVHQACLMEWLSHSQKKYCELCKTPFRFTKLYDPHMPGRLPTPIFIRQLIVHVFKAIITWARCLLVAIVWLGWLPWSMRQVWRILFYIIEGRWSAQFATHAPAIYSQITNDTNAAFMSDFNNATVLQGETNVTLKEGLISTMPQLLAPLTSLIGVSNSQFLLLKIIQTMFPSFFRWTQSISADYTLDANADGQPVSLILHRQTLLGEVKCLKTLTISPTINNTIIDILEGQLICLSLVVVTILLFLIREWVINQGPGNVPEVANAEVGVNGQVDQPGQEPRQDGRPHRVQHDDRGPGIDSDGGTVSGVLAVDDTRNQTPTGQDQDSGTSQDDVNSSARQGTEDNPADQDDHSFARSSSRNRPTLTNRNAMDDATSIRRSIEEQSDSSLPWPGLETLKDLWHRADGDPARVLEIIDREGRKEQLAWVVAHMEKLRNENREIGLSSNSVGRGSSEDQGPNSSNIGNTLKHQEAPLVPLSVPESEDDVIPRSIQGQSEWSFDRLNTSIADAVQNGDILERPSITAENSNEEASVVEHDAVDLGDGEVLREPDPDSRDVSPVESDPPRSKFDALMNWFWGNELYTRDREDREYNTGEDDARVVDNLDHEAPFVPVQRQQAAQRQPADPPPVVRDPEVVAAAAEAGLDLNNIEAAEDIEDLEGILELIGIQGPIAGLIQNVLFSQFLISLTLVAGVGIPYIWGMVGLHVLSHPLAVFVKLPVAIVTSIVDLTADTVFFTAGLAAYSGLLVINAIPRLIGILVPSFGQLFSLSKITNSSLTIVSRSGARLEKTLASLFIGDGFSLPRMSLSARRSLRIFEELVPRAFTYMSNAGFLQSPEPPHNLDLVVRTSLKSLIQRTLASSFEPLETLRVIVTQCRGLYYDIASWIAPNELGTHEMWAWTATDKAITITLGYAAVVMLGFMYLKFSRWFFRLKKEDNVDGILAEGIHQAGGVLKVILIISIEMIVFPFYCGTLLDLALLPLFQDASLRSRIDFFSQSPLTALFVHWFVGTCYMFHFALFVSTCRKIVRKGVLYFIRDPEDPTFHPVRDVLERSVATQLSKIAFSALVYGGLVMVCLGGVVWSLSFVDSVLPIHWSSGGPTLEFPIDLIFYTFVLPVLLRYVELSKKIDAGYKWWFGKVARWLRLSDFLFGERHKDELGRHVRQTWRDVLSGNRGDVEHPIVGEDHQNHREERQGGAYFLRDGRFVRTPASDQVRIPRGQLVFLEVTETNERTDGRPDSEDGPYGKSNPEFTVVYVPPWFRTRIALFIAHVWFFTAIVGVSFTILPLLAGRGFLKTVSPSTTEINDLYAFTMGCSILLVAIYGFLQFTPLWARFKSQAAPRFRLSSEAINKTLMTVKRMCGLVYLCTVTGVILPLALALLAELYIFIPLHTYLSLLLDSSSSTASRNWFVVDSFQPSFASLHDPSPQSHTVYIVQAWLLGVLLLRLSLRVALTTPAPNTLLATALRSIVSPPQNSVLNPNVRLATRAFILPSMMLSAFLFLAPLLLGYLVNQTPNFVHQDIVVQTKVYRYSYPGLMAVAVVAWCSILLKKAIERWKLRIRDEVYLVGERLHNFGESRRGNKGKERADGGRRNDGGGGAGIAIL